jgi:hypothetical protein
MNTMTNDLFDLRYLDNINNNQNTVNPSLMQGFEFTQSQNKFKEGFASDYEKNVNQYNNSIQQYSDFQSVFQKDAAKISQRIDPVNELLNKIIRFSTGELCYVTNQGVAKLIPSPEILNSISQKNGCPSNNSRNFININIPWRSEYNVEGTEIPTNPPLIIGKKMQLNQSCGNEGSNVIVEYVLPTDPIPSYVGCYKDNEYNPTFTKLSGNYNFEQCKNAAMNRGYQYYSLNNVDVSNKIGNCLVSNNKNTVINNGLSYDFVPIWSSNTNGQPGTFATITNNGILCVSDKDNKFYFETRPDTNCTVTNYTLIPNTDAAGNDIDFISNVTPDNCKTRCTNDSNCGGFVFNTYTNNDCWIKNGTLSNGVNNINSRSIYKKSVNTSNCKFYLNLQDDGNMCIFRGVPNRRNNTLIWCSDTKGKQLLKNDNFVASKGKYGLPILTTNQILNKGDFISSSSGNLVLKMENDGNLVLYTFQLTCYNALNDLSYYYGKNSATALYDIGAVGVVSNMGKVGYVDADSQIHTYPDSNIGYSDNFMRSYPDTDISGYDVSIAGVKQSNLSSAQCMNILRNYPECNAFVYDTTGPSPICLPKKIPDKDIYSPNNFTPSFGKTTYLRDRKIINPPIGINNTINGIDSVSYNNYGKQGGDLQKSYGLGKLLLDNTNKLDGLQQNINQNLNSLANFRKEGFEGLTQQNVPSNFSDPLSKTQQIKQKIQELKNSEEMVDNILTDTNIKILQKNYSYIAWSILALGAVLVTLKIKNSQ